MKKTMRSLKRTPLFSEHVALGANMGSFAGYEMPIEYVGIMEEHRAVRERVGLFDVSHMTAIRVFGTGAGEGLQRLLTNDLARLSDVGLAQYSLVCEEDGGILDDVIVYRTSEEEYLVVGNAANRETVVDWLGTRLGVAATVSDESDLTAILAVQGPGAISAVSELAGGDWSPPTRFAVNPATLAGASTLISRTGYTGEDGVEIVCDASLAVRLWHTLLSLEDVMPCGLGARDTLRLEMGYPLYGADISREADPVSAGLMWAVDLDKGHFVGSASIGRIVREGPERRRIGLTLERGIPRAGFSVLRDGHEVGKVASGTYGPTVARGIAVAYLPVDLAVEGTGVEIAIRRGIVPATVVALPFVRGTSLGRES